MSGPSTAAPYDCSPEQALQALREHPGSLLVDLDETLYLRNSSEDFIDCARPGQLALVALRLLDVLSPWRWSGGVQTRDCWRVALILILFPWTPLVWRARCAGLARRHRNQPLLDALQSCTGTPVVTTLGFRSIVRPLVSALGLPGVRIVASRVFVLEDRRRGKLGQVVEALGEQTVRESLTLTDSMTDAPLLAFCARPLRTIWPDARFSPAFSGMYFPGQYISQVKHPGQGYIRRGILMEDFALWVLASEALAVHPLMHVLGLGLLLLSLWAIYERGYVENDLFAARYEEQPKLTDSFHQMRVATPWLPPWIWALSAGAAGDWVLRWPQPVEPRDLVLWTSVLLATYGWFLLYNSYDKATRVWLYNGLQLSRIAGFVVLVQISAIGAAALAAHLFSRWLPYYVYRYGSKAWPTIPIKLIRLMLFTTFVGLLAAAHDVKLGLDWGGAAMVAWNIYRAIPEIRTVFRSASRLDRSTPRQNT